MAQRFQSLSFKVIATFILLTALAVGTISVLGYFTSSRISDDQALKAKESVLIFRGDMLQDQLEQLENQANSIARIEALQMSLTSLKSGWKTIEKNGDARAELKKVFITNNPNPADQREKLMKPEGPSGFYYSNHEKTQGEVARDLENTAFSDLLITDMDGTVLYSYKKDDNFAENLKADAWKVTGAGIAYGRAVENTAKATDDFAPTAFSGLRVDSANGNSAIFYAVPFVKLGQPKGVILFKVRDDVIASILSKGIVSGSTAQAAIISSDGSAIGLDAGGKLAPLDTAPFTFVKDALANSKPITVDDFARADGAARAYVRGIEYHGDRFLVVESVLLSELNAGSIEIAMLLTMIGLGALVVMAIATGLITKLLFSPLARLAASTRDVADGKLDTEIGSQNRHDEIGTMAKALDRFKQSLIESRALEAANAETRARAERDRQENLNLREAEAKTLQEVVQALDEGLHHLANGDLAYQIGTRFPNELEGLRINFNEALAALSETMMAIGGNSMAVRSGAEEMRTGADELAGRTERQAASITETANAIGAITQAVRTQIERAEQAERIARDAKKETTGSGQIMRETIAAMEAIQSSSRQINTIISVIDDIAFQTNLLALNAGVEAARAGESGKGFAVVAMEVRELAQRSSSAAKEISSLLKKSTHEVETGVSLVERAGLALTGIGGHVEAINGQVHEIMESTREEADTLRQINASVSELDSMTQQNAAMVEETTAAIHRLATEAGEMDRQLGNFTLPQGQHHHSAEIHVLRHRR